MKLTPKPIADRIHRLEKEAERFEQLAREAALKAIENLGNNKFGEQQKLCLDHRLRAETFKTAATLISK